MPFGREKMKEKAGALAVSGVYIGTSSWKYEGWYGQPYTPSRTWLNIHKATSELRWVRFPAGWAPLILTKTGWFNHSFTGIRI